MTSRSKLIVSCVLMLLVLVTSVIFVACSRKSAPTSHFAAKRLIKISGDGQSVKTHDSLSERMIVEIRDSTDQPIVNQRILYVLTEGWGEVFAKPSVAGKVATPLEVIMSTDYRGRTAANFRAFLDTLNRTALVRVSPTEDSSMVVQFTIYRTP